MDVRCCAYPRDIHAANEVIHKTVRRNTDVILLTARCLLSSSVTDNALARSRSDDEQSSPIGLCRANEYQINYVREALSVDVDKSRHELHDVIRERLSTYIVLDA